MPINAILLSAAAGLISAIVFASATTGAPLLRMVLYFLTPLPLYLAGLGLGPTAVGIAALTATIAILTLANGPVGFLFAASTAAPAVLLSRLTLLNRSTGNGEEVEWYPIGRLLTVAAAFGGAVALISLVMLGGGEEGLAKAVRTALDGFAKSELARMPGAPALTDAQIDEMAKSALKLLPWALGVLSTATIVLNLWLSGRLTLASGRLMRPWPKLTTVAVPGAATFVLLGGLALSFLGGLPGLIGASMAGAFILVFALVGLATIHVVSEGSPWRSFLLAATYATVVFLTSPAAILLAIIGIAETVFKYRSYGPGPPPENPN
jgi:hypothetical protein